MKLDFLNRSREIERLQKTLASTDEHHLLVLYGRRRLGKSTLLQHVLGDSDVYYLATQSDQVLQRQNLAREIARILLGFDAVHYPDWDTIFKQLALRVRPGTVLVLDEFPYLVAESPELASVIQNLVDTRALNYHLVLCGSSQRMMHGLALDQAAPLYGRAQEILKIEPLAVGWLQKAVYPDPAQCVEAYSVWGGVPRYWELAADFPNLEEAVKYLVLDKYGVLHQEPQRLLLDDMNRTTQTNSIISVIAYGAHRLTEIGGRLEKKATILSRPIANLKDLGYLMREVPFGALQKSSKKALYKIADPYLQFWYRFVFPHLSLLEVDRIDEVYRLIQEQFPQHVSGVWEELARKSCAYVEIGGTVWHPGMRWWGNGRNGDALEIDLLAESLDKTRLLVGEVKWREQIDLDKTLFTLRQKIENLPLRKKYAQVELALWSKQPLESPACHVITPEQLCGILF